MKKMLLLFLSLVAATAFMNAQNQAELVSDCALGIGANTTYLKDFVIKLPDGTDTSNPPIFKANIYLMKNQNYRFTMCDAEEDVKGELVLALYDKTKLIISTYNSKSGSVANSFDFSCNKTGLYQLWYTFKEGQKGMGVGIVSLVK